MTLAWVPGKTPEQGAAQRSIEQYQLVHERQGRLLQHPSVTTGSTFGPGDPPFSFVASGLGVATADAGHDAFVVTNGGYDCLIPDLTNTRYRIELTATCPGFYYTVDPGANALMSLQITDSANNVLAEGFSTYLTGLNFAGACIARRVVSNLTIPAGVIRLKLRVTSSVITQPYAIYGTATSHTTMSAILI